MRISKTIKYFFIGVLLFFTTTKIDAQNGDTTITQKADLSQDMKKDSEETADEKNSFHVTGFAELDHISYFRQKYAGKIYSRNQGLLQLNLSSSIKNKASMYSSIELREDLSNSARNRIFLREAYVDLFLKNLDIRAGKQIVTWGAADAINYTNNINPVDYTDLLDTRYQTIGVFSLKAKYYIKDWKLEGIFVPVFNPSVLPPMNSPWVEEFPRFIPDPSSPPNYFKASYGFSDPVRPPSDLRSSQFAAKISTTKGGADFSVSYYNGYNDIPSQFNQIPGVVSSDSIHILLQPEYRKWQVFGADFSSAIGSWGIRGEGAYIVTDNKPGTSFKIHPYFQYVIGIDHNFSDVIGTNNLFVLTQWIHEITTKGQTFSNRDLNHLFQRSIMARAELEIGTDGKLSLQGIYNFIPKDYYIRPEFSYNILDGLNVTALVDILDGSRNGFFGNFKDNKRVQLRLKYNF